MVGSGNKMTVNGQGAGEIITIMGDTGNVGINETNPIGDLSLTGANGTSMVLQLVLLMVQTELQMEQINIYI